MWYLSKMGLKLTMSQLFCAAPYRKYKMNISLFPVISIRASDKELSKKFYCTRADLNSQPSDHKSNTLPTELTGTTGMGLFVALDNWLHREAFGLCQLIHQCIWFSCTSMCVRAGMGDSYYIQQNRYMLWYQYCHWDINIDCLMV